MSRLLATALAACALLMSSHAALEVNNNAYGTLDANRGVPEPPHGKCRGEEDGFRFEWGAPHACDPKDPRRCRVGEEGITYRDCLAINRRGQEFITHLNEQVKCRVERCDNRRLYDDEYDYSRPVRVPNPKKCHGKEDGFRFEWGAPHACDPKDPQRCRVGQEGITYRDCLAINERTGQQFITALNEPVKCKVERCDRPHRPYALYGAEEEDSSLELEEEVVELEVNLYGQEGKYDAVELAHFAPTLMASEVEVQNDRRVPTPRKCRGEEDGFRFEWGAPHACDPKDPRRCRVGEEGVTYRDCLAINRRGQEFITGLNEQVRCRVERCDNRRY